MDNTKADLKQTFYAAEQSGLKLAIKGRFVALALIGIWMVTTRSSDRALDTIIAISVLAVLGLLHHLVIGSRFDRSWVKYIFLTIDILLLSISMAVLSPEPIFNPPQIFMFKFGVFPYYFVILAVAAFSFSPGLILWGGFLGAAGWLSAFAWVRSGMEEVLDWGQAVKSETTEGFIEVFLSPIFVGSGTRVQEALMLMIVALILAVVMQRARQTVRRQAEAERDTAAVSQMFGQFVPETIARSMIEDKGVLQPVEREASVLFLDIVEFTNMTEAKGPAKTVEILNAFFDKVTEIITKHDGVVTQFQGDAVLAVFNVPIENASHAENAFSAAKEILKSVQENRFSDENIGVRIGLSTGPVVAGNVGGGGRHSYTVYGDTVNLAARLEAANKEFGTSILISEWMVTKLSNHGLKPIGETQIKGLREPVGVLTIAGT